LRLLENVGVNIPGALLVLVTGIHGPSLMSFW
jgi:hypothetical protein